MSLFFVYCGTNFERGIYIKPVDLTAEESYNANAPAGGREGVDSVGAFLRPHN